MTKYERELSSLKGELNGIPRAIRGTKRRGAEIRKAEKDWRKAKVRVETCRRACRALPKHWEEYKPIGKYGYQFLKYSRDEVTQMHIAIVKSNQAAEWLFRTIESYNKRRADRKALRESLRRLPGEIEALEQLIEIAAKRKKPAKKEVDWKSKWQEVAPGLVVSVKILTAYLKTFKHECFPMGEESSSVVNNVFTFKPFSWKESVYLKLPCYTWEQAQNQCRI